MPQRTIAQTPPELYNEASVLYKANQFTEAAAVYEKITAQGYRSAEVYYNLGNCYYKMHNTGKAILNYERALKLAPDDEDIAHNLKLAQLTTIDRVQPVPQLAIVTKWNNLLHSFSSKGWAVFALVLVWLSLILFAIYLFVSRKGVVLFFTITVFLLSLVSVGLGVKQAHTEDDSGTAILMVANVNVKSAPDESATDIFTIHEGIKLYLCDRVGNWNKIRLADGKVGWVEKNLFEKI
ncbi:MAG TPA: tetratricopeptide repeat protein [Chitinophagales bacterium]|nr:tetratricopeptide repeat protein [Chitinophagales bacterium]